MTLDGLLDGRDDCRMLRRDIVRFAGVFAEVEQQRRLVRFPFARTVAGLGLKMGLEHPLAHREQPRTAILAISIPLDRPGAQQHRTQIQPVDDAIRRHISPGQS